MHDRRGQKRYNARSCGLEDMKGPLDAFMAVSILILKLQEPNAKARGIGGPRTYGYSTKWERVHMRSHWSQRACVV